MYMYCLEMSIFERITLSPFTANHISLHGSYAIMYRLVHYLGTGYICMFTCTWATILIFIAIAMRAILHIILDQEKFDFQLPTIQSLQMTWLFLVFLLQ